MVTCRPRADNTHTYMYPQHARTHARTHSYRVVRRARRNKIETDAIHVFLTTSRPTAKFNTECSTDNSVPQSIQEFCTRCATDNFVPPAPESLYDVGYSQFCTNCYREFVPRSKFTTSTQCRRLAFRHANTATHASADRRFFCITLHLNHSHPKRSNERESQEIHVGTSGNI